MSENSTETKVIGIDGKMKKQFSRTRNLGAQEKQLNEMKEKMASGEIMWGRIEGVEKIVDGPSVACIFMDGIKVLIAAEDLLPPSVFEKMAAKETVDILLSRRIGAEVDFVIKDINEEAKLAAGNRLEAMEARKKDTFFATDEDGNYLINDGDIIECRVVNVKRSGATVEVFGVEKDIELKDMFYQRVFDCRTKLNPGQRVYVRISDIKRDNGTNSVDMNVSIKEAKENPLPELMKKYAIEGRYIGTVTFTDKQGVYVSLPGGIDCLCKYPERGMIPPRDTEVVVRITMKNEEENRLFGLIVNSERI